MILWTDSVHPQNQSSHKDQEQEPPRALIRYPWGGSWTPSQGTSALPALSTNRNPANTFPHTTKHYIHYNTLQHIHSHKHTGAPTSCCHSPTTNCSPGSQSKDRNSHHTRHLKQMGTLFFIPLASSGLPKEEAKEKWGVGEREDGSAEGCHSMFLPPNPVSTHNAKTPAKKNKILM